MRNILQSHSHDSGIKQFLESKNIKNANIIGWSLGGHIAYGIAAENKELASSIVTIGSPPVLFSTSGFKKGFGEWFVNSLLPEWVDRPKSYKPEEASIVRDSIGFKSDDKYFNNDIMNADPQMRRNLFLKLKEYDSAQYRNSGLNGEYFIKQTDIPVCLMVGKNDAGINSDYIASFNKTLINNNSMVQVIEGAPHPVFASHPEEFYRTVDKFLENVRLQSTARQIPT